MKGFGSRGKSTPKHEQLDRLTEPRAGSVTEVRPDFFAGGGGASFCTVCGNGYDPALGHTCTNSTGGCVIGPVQGGRPDFLRQADADPGYEICTRCMRGVEYCICAPEGVLRRSLRRSAERSEQSRTKASNPKDLVGDKKIPLWLLSPIACAHWALAQFAGMLKYGAWNYREVGVRYSVYISAMQRHIDGIKSGETVDPIDGTDHLGNIMACAAIILDARAAGKLTDDRPPAVDHRPTYKDLEVLMAKLREQYADRTPTHYTINGPAS